MGASPPSTDLRAKLQLLSLDAAIVEDEHEHDYAAPRAASHPGGLRPTLTHAPRYRIRPDWALDDIADED